MKNQPRPNSSWVFVHLGVTAIILFRTLLYVLYGTENMNTDEASFGLMAKHLAEGREFPIFFYGQNYPFVISSWAAAPLFKLFGSSIAMLRLPLLVWNLVTGNLLVRLLRTECGLAAKWAFICSLWFLLPSVMSSNDWMDASKMSETFLFILLLWVLRKKPIVSGLIAGIGTIQRPFMLYGVVSLAFLEWRAAGAKKSAFFRTQILRFLGLAASYSFIRILAVYGTNYYGKGTHFWVKRIRFILEDTRGFFAEIMTRTIGVKFQEIPRPPIKMIDSYYTPFGLVLAGLGACLLLWFIVAVWRSRRELWLQSAEERPRFAFYLAFTGVVCFGGYIVLSPPDPHIHYTQLLIFGLVGIYALQVLLGTSSRLRILSLAFLFGCMANNLVANARAWPDLARLDHEHPLGNLISYLKQHGIRAGVGDYGSNHNITFASDEQSVIADRWPASRFPQQTAVIRATPVENRAWIGLNPCPGGVLVEIWYVCPFSAAPPYVL